ncbi:hypothetical protein EYF80_051242 [Liparis tanakae]|uniref:Uncharacterized protein n=1 Tax=Liparis tanakae TaxID=230148 RepID=A0A4Z2FBL3_9TELE|nr:hypothetical protein EYF80_051242 [Liparis tanakae]
MAFEHHPIRVPLHGPLCPHRTANRLPLDVNAPPASGCSCADCLTLEAQNERRLNHELHTNIQTNASTGITRRPLQSLLQRAFHHVDLLPPSSRLTLAPTFIQR